MAKSPEAFRTISEVASELDVPQHVLRFWETKFSQLKPMKRGGGRRYYRPDDVALLRGIRALLYTEGFTIKGVQKVLREQGARRVMETGHAIAGGGSQSPLVALETEAARAAADAADLADRVLGGPELERLRELISELEELRDRLRAD